MSHALSPSRRNTAKGSEHGVLDLWGDSSHLFCIVSERDKAAFEVVI